MNKPIFVNRILNLKKIKAIGLDMDHTLLRYDIEAFEALTFQLVVERLIKDKAYPEVLRTLTFNMHAAIRGLVVDGEHGNILKLSRFGAIRESYHGTKPIDFKSQQAFYGSTYIDLNNPNYEVIDTSFSIAFCVLYSQLVDLKDENPDAYPSYAILSEDVMTAVDDTHRDGTLKSIIMQDVEKYIIQDKRLVEMMARFVRFGKDIILITNSEYGYMKTLLDYAINPFLPKGQTWDTFFKYVIASSRKPSFFYESEPFLAINVEDGEISRLQGELKPGVYQGGNAKALTEAMQLSGDEILYIGDHIYGDILRLKKACRWRTAMVAEELGEEIEAQNKAFATTERIAAEMSKKSKLERKHVKWLTKQLDGVSGVDETQIQALQEEIMQIDTEVAKLLGEERSYYNPMWGQVFRAGAEESYFAYQVERYACIYMEKLVDFFACSPLTYFRANRRKLPHDP